MKNAVPLSPAQNLSKKEGNLPEINFAHEELGVQEVTDELSMEVGTDSLVIASPTGVWPYLRTTLESPSKRLSPWGRVSQRLRSVKILTQLAVNTARQVRTDHIVQGRTLLPTLNDEVHEILSRSSAHRRYFQLIVTSMFIYDKYVLFPATIAMILALLVSVINLCVFFVKAFKEPPHLILDTTQYLPLIRNLTLVLLVVEFFDSLLFQLNTGYDHVRSIILLGIMASARQLIFVDTETQSFYRVVGFGSLCLSLGMLLAFFSADLPSMDFLDDQQQSAQQPGRPTKTAVT